MQIDFRSYPHPVLSPFSDDLVGCQFQCGLKPGRDGHEFKFEAAARVSSEGLEQLIGRGEAVFAVHVECPATRFRRLWRFQEQRTDFRIPVEMLEGKVHVCSFILANADIENYTNNDFHPDYNEAKFNIKRGDILAVDENRAFEVEPNQDPLRSIPSIFTISPNTLDNPPAIDIDSQGHKIVIKLPLESYERYLEMAADPGLPKILNSMLILPALACILEQVNPENQRGAGEHGLENLRWYRVLRKKLGEKGVRLDGEQGFTDSSLSLASRLLGDLLSEGLDELKTIALSE